MSDDADRGFLDWGPNSRTKEVVDQILRVIQTYRDAGVPAPTVRDVYYNLIGRYGYKKSEALNRKVYRLLRKMRRSGMIGFDEIDDDSPTMLTGSGHDDPAQFWRVVKSSANYYNRDLLQGQPYRVIVLTEGASKVRQFRTVTRDYDIAVYSGGGWESIRLKHDLAVDAASEYEKRGRPTLALHCGDFDPDGVAIFESGVDDVRAFISGMIDAAPEVVLQVERIMLLPEQRHMVPERGVARIDRSKIEAKDYRGQKWPHDWRCELEALEIPDRLEILRAKIDEVLDHDQLSAVREQGEAERDEIVTRIDELLGEDE